MPHLCKIPAYNKTFFFWLHQLGGIFCPKSFISYWNSRSLAVCSNLMQTERKRFSCLKGQRLQSENTQEQSIWTFENALGSKRVLQRGNTKGRWFHFTVVSQGEQCVINEKWFWRATGVLECNLTTRNAVLLLKTKWRPSCHFCLALANVAVEGFWNGTLSLV